MAREKHTGLQERVRQRRGNSWQKEKLGLDRVQQARCPGHTFKEARTLGLVLRQGQHRRASASLRVVPWASGLPHPVQAQGDRGGSRQRKVKTEMERKETEAPRETKRGGERQRRRGRVTEGETQGHGQSLMV